MAELVQNASEYEDERLHRQLELASMAHSLGIVAPYVSIEIPKLEPDGKLFVENVEIQSAFVRLAQAVDESDMNQQ